MTIPPQIRARPVKSARPRLWKNGSDVHSTLVRLPVALALIGLAACGPGTRLREEFQTSDYFMRLEEELSLELSAPIIVLGEVLEVKDSGPPKRLDADPRVGAQLKRIRIRVQTVIKGQVDADVIELFYFAFVSRLSRVSVKPTYQPKVGNYRIFFLRPSGESYRSVRDIKNYTIPVHSGSHRRESCQGMTAGCCIAQILLTPQADIDVKWFSLYLVEPAAIAEVACSQETALKLLQPLTEYPDIDIADRARQIIADIERRRKKKTDRP